MRIFVVLFAFALGILNNHAQEHKNPVSNLKAIKNGTTIFYADEGVNFTSQTFNNTFSLKGLKKIFNKQDRVFERKYIDLILNDGIAKSSFQPLKMDSIDFAGRPLKLSSSECHWTTINSIQCPYYGQISWSLHSSLEEANLRKNTQILLTKNKKGTKVTSEQIIAIEFEGNPAKAIKIVYELKGVNSLLAGMSGAKHLTVYYVATEIRDTYISCILSNWNNDVKTDNGLAPLLAEIMKLH